ncbi:AlkZ family DNA glycosylase [Actinotalea ferrariae]|uniref:winged helix DNA-binding domain-containing protein n=1 Tax=Actinotalea ferrariae TaxID=1386098 RepID=UPI001C8C69A3|nr:winged helix DNA-binding domain-containing protein [Actinotalea ferrariae]MBX9245158.1 AlkZ family DNA glycosylase [Actinotalea ferrariae]
MVDVVSLRVLNRTFLARQHLDARVSAAVEDVVGQLLAVQAQEPNWAIVGLASRVEGLSAADLERAVEDRVLVRSPLLRGTQHLLRGDDYVWVRPTIHPVLERLTRSPYYAEQTAGIAPEELVDAALDALGDGLVPRRDVGAALVARFPGRKAAVLAAAVESAVPVVHGPRTSAWGSWWSRRGIEVARAEAWLGRPMAQPDVRRLVRRYLAAYGPAGVMDVQAWSGLTRLAPLLAEMRGELRVLRGPDGAELFDLPDAVLADEDAPAPVRFVAAFDNAVLGHRDRTRILPEEVRRTVMPGYSMVHATVLVDGFVAATWELADGDVVVHPQRPLTPRERDQVAEEGERVRAIVGLADGEVVLR